MLNELENQISDTLFVWHKGEQNAISYSNLSCVLDINSRQLRRIVSHLVTEHRVPICSISAHGKGYFYAEKPEEFIHAYNELMSRSRKLALRAQSFKTACLGLNSDKLFEEAI